MKALCCSFFKRRIETIGIKDNKIINTNRAFKFSEKIPEIKGAQDIPNAVGAPIYPFILPMILGSKNKFGR